MPPYSIQTWRARVAKGEQEIPRNPCRHADQNHSLHSEPPEEEGNQEHEEDLAHLAERHLARGVGDTHLVEKRFVERVVELSGMQIRNEPSTKTRNDRLCSSLSASSPSTVCSACAGARAAAAACAGSVRQ